MTSLAFDGAGERVAGEASVLSYAEAARLAAEAEVDVTAQPKPSEFVVTEGDKMLMAALPEALMGVRFADHMVVKDGAQTTADPAEFSLLPIIGPERIAQRSVVGGVMIYTAVERYGDYVKPKGARCDYHEGCAYLDAPAAIGLVYDGVVRAVASAATEGDAVRIIQLQGMLPRKRTEEMLLASGLYDGFKWRHTLVEAWTEVAQNLGFAAIEVQGYVNNRWKKDYDPARTIRLKVGHDRVAKQQGFALTPQGNWRKELIS